MLYFIFTIDGDWKEYFDIDLPEKERAPKEDVLKGLVRKEIISASENLRGRFIHFIHFSQRSGDFFLRDSFLELWKEILKNNGGIGLHLHMDDPYKYYYYQDTGRIKSVVSEKMRLFKRLGLGIKCYRGGFLGFSDSMPRVLEENGIYFDFSCEPGRSLWHDGVLICDWKDAPLNFYRMDYADHRREGGSGVWEIPVGASEGKYLYFEKSDLRTIEKIASKLKKRSIEESRDIIVSVLTHTYEYASQEKIEDIERKLSILRGYGNFINIRELEDVINTRV